MPNTLKLILVGALLALAFGAGRWTLASPGAVFAATPSLMSAQATNNCASPALPPVIVKVPEPFAGTSANELNKQLLDNKKRIPSAATQEEQQQLLAALAAVDPRAAMAEAQQLKGDRQAQAVAAVLAVWGEHDPEGAWSWVAAGNPDNIYQFDQLLEVFGKNNPEAAARYANSLATTRPELTQEVYLSALMGITHAGGYEAARQLAESANISAVDRAVLLNYVAGAWGGYEPEAAMAWVMGLSGELQNSALVGLGESWSNLNPPAAANFAAGLGASPQRQLLLQQAISKWLMDDPAAVTNWLAAAENHQDYDQAINTLATLPGMMRDHTQTALSWSERIYDTNLRVTALQQILAEMKLKDPASAVAYVRSAPSLTLLQRTQLLNGLGEK